MHLPIDDPARPTEVRGLWVFGTIALLLAAAIPCLAVIEWAARIDLPMPGSWYSARPLWYFFAVLSAIAGVRLLRSSGPSSDRWKPTRPGRRFERVLLYTREECHLCDHARDSLWKYAAWLPPLEEVDVDADPQLVERFDTCVPVVEIDGKVRFRGRIDEILLRRLIENAPPNPAPTTERDE
ncbi:MAG: glutaredoxin family protein [Planctomycetaceae bacterium]